MQVLIPHGILMLPCCILRIVVGPLYFYFLHSFFIEPCFLLALFFPSVNFISSFFSCKYFSLFHIATSWNNSSHYSFWHTLMILATMPYSFLSFLFLSPLTLLGSNIPSLLHNPSMIHLSKDFTWKESANSSL